MNSVKGNLVDFWKKKIYEAEVKFDNGKIISIIQLNKISDKNLPYIMPGFIDSHIHIESSMLIPSEFARLAVNHGTVATVSDPHEIANVCGMKGVKYMIENGRKVPFKFYFGAPSCVPATTFETPGDKLDSNDVDQLLRMDEIHYLSEMMNFPGVLNSDSEVMKKISSAKKYNKPVDGHAPGLRGESAKKYVDAGISTDHECFTKEEALDKLKYGMKILIREGSAAKNFEALIDLLNDYPDDIMFCSDDKHPDSLVEGHINQLCARAIEKGIDLFKVIQAACINPVGHYKLNVGLLRINDPADFILVDNLKSFHVKETFINGESVSENGITKILSLKAEIINHFKCEKKLVEDFKIKSGKKLPVIGALDGQLITEKINLLPKELNGYYESDIENDILKIVVVNRYNSNAISRAFIKNFGLKQGALASTVAHDSHNIVAVGVADESLCEAVNLLIETKGGVSCVNGNDKRVLVLPVAGLMSNENGFEVAAQYTLIDRMAKKNGSTLAAPFMTLSFMALLVIPHLKISDKGLFDGDSFQLLN